MALFVQRTPLMKSIRSLLTSVFTSQNNRCFRLFSSCTARQAGFQTEEETPRLERFRDYNPKSPYKQPGPRRYGYNNKMFSGGLLPRPHINKGLPLPVYSPKDTWARKSALFGQNDYIDILGDGNVHPVDLMKGPGWLIGFKGNELQRLGRRFRFEGHRMKMLYPTQYDQMKKRIYFLHKKYNRGRQSHSW